MNKYTLFYPRLPAGSRFVETILSLVDTCQKQTRNAFEFLAIAVTDAGRLSN
jgi:hypothetical protein